MVTVSILSFYPGAGEAERELRQVSEEAGGRGDHPAPLHGEAQVSALVAHGTAPPPQPWPHSTGLHLPTTDNNNR